MSVMLLRWERLGGVGTEASKLREASRKRSKSVVTAPLGAALWTLWRKRWKAASAGSRFEGIGRLVGDLFMLGKAGMGGMAVSGEESEPWAENQERRLRLLPL